MKLKEIQKVEQLTSRMLNEYGLNQLASFGIYKKLFLLLSINDITTLVENRIYFNPIFSPASQSKLKLDLERGANIITIDLNTIKLFSSDEGTAIILHEIGHALNPELRNMEGEYAADNYASETGFSQHIISTLEKEKLIRPAEFSTQSTELRIERLNNNS